jgi:hypothetical protein
MARLARLGRLATVQFHSHESALLGHGDFFWMVEKLFWQRVDAGHWPSSLSLLEAGFFALYRLACAVAQVPELLCISDMEGHCQFSHVSVE